MNRIENYRRMKGKSDKFLFQLSNVVFKECKIRRGIKALPAFYFVFCEVCFSMKLTRQNSRVYF